MRERSYNIRPATLKDTDFIAGAIIQAEKSGTEKLGLATLFGLTEEEVGQYLRQMLEEEVDGCEFSISSFLIAEINGECAATAAGWIEGLNEDHIPSSMLKSNLLGYVLPKSSLERAGQLSPVIRDIQIEREEGSYQIEYVYTQPRYRGLGLTGMLLQAHIRKGVQSNGALRKIQVQSFANNVKAVKVYERAGFTVVKEYAAKDRLILDYLPGQSKLVLEKIIN